MRNIKVTFRAVFQQPIGVLNPMGLRMSAQVPVEVFQRGAHWYAREIEFVREFTRLGRFDSAEHAKQGVYDAFETTVQDWQVWGTMPGDGVTALAVERLLTPYDVADLGDGKFAAYEPKDRTHIIHAPSIPPGARIPPAACGAILDAKCFISTKANVEPSCKECAEVWRREYQGK